MSRARMKPPLAGIRSRTRDQSGEDGAPRRPGNAATMHGRQKVRITGGVMRSRQVTFPAARGLRPTPDRVRETLFNWLGQDLTGWRVLDLFAGSGVLGMEALSRGAAWLGVVEQSARVAEAIRQNMMTLAVPDEQVRIWRTDATAWIRQSEQWLEGTAPIDLVFLDPPFAEPALLETVLAGLNAVRWLAPDAILYVEHSAAMAPIELPGWERTRQGQAGESLFMLWARRADGADVSPPG
ncbi:16S rRNA (guanine(966)-N(2))-methyltransferase RsmD [Halothiobacillus diazotrophicus]|nr:16S rRNA (guanine(966)-N(2))-methyltransferase RsmD [Halothiobacillus diazotrophicus]